MIRLSSLIAVLVLLPGMISPAAASPPDLGETLKQGRFISYTPRKFTVVSGRTQPVTAQDVLEDLTLLKPDFDSLITYSCMNGLEHVPAAAEKLGYRAVIIGIWDPGSDAEVETAIRLAGRYPELIAAVAIGNEGIYAKRYGTADVEKAFLRIRKALPSLKLTTSEPFFLYLKPEYFDYFNRMDLLLPNIHPVFEKWFRPADAGNAAAFVVNVADRLQSRYARPLIVKETGMPSGPTSAGFTEAYQSAFWVELLKRLAVSETRSVSCFEAFDAPWKPAVIREDFPESNHETEAFWGFYTAGGKSKPVVGAVRQFRRKR